MPSTRPFPPLRHCKCHTKLGEGLLVCPRQLSCPLGVEILGPANLAFSRMACALIFRGRNSNFTTRLLTINNSSSHHKGLSSRQLSDCFGYNVEKKGSWSLHGRRKGADDMQPFWLPTPTALKSASRGINFLDSQALALPLSKSDDAR